MQPGAPASPGAASSAPSQGAGVAQTAKEERKIPVMKMSSLGVSIKNPQRDQVSQNATTTYPSLDIFLHADVNLRTEHIQKLGLNGKEDPRKYLTKMDNLRETYFKTYTKHELGTYHDYDLCLDTGTLGYDNCIEIITSLAKQQGLNLKHQ